MSLAVVLSPLFAPSRQRPDSPVPFDPPAIFTDFFGDHFNIELIAGDRLLFFGEYQSWLSRAKPAEIFRSERKNGFIHFEPPSGLPLRERSFDCLFLPLLGLATAPEWAGQLEEWKEGLSEIQTTIFRHRVEPVLGVVPGIDKIFLLGPFPSRQVNSMIFHLHGQVSDECRLHQWPLPPLFAILDFKVIEGLPERYPVSF